jgi:hypothetical protein
VRLSLRSLPADAEVADAQGKVLGKTPLSIDRPKGSGKLVLTVRRAGYADRKVELETEKDSTQEVSLEAAPSPSRSPGRVAKPSRSSRAKAKPKTEAVRLVD